MKAEEIRVEEEMGQFKIMKRKRKKEKRIKQSK